MSTLASKDTTRRRGHDRKGSLFLPSSFMRDLLSGAGVGEQHTHGEMCSSFAFSLIFSFSRSPRSQCIFAGKDIYPGRK